MGSKFETLEPNKVKITFNIDADKFEEGCQTAYMENRGKFNIPGFRKGKAPRKIIEVNFGKGIFFEDAVNILLPDAYDEAIKELGLETVSRPDIDIDDISDDEGVALSATVFIKPKVKVEKEAYEKVEYEPLSVEIEESEIDEEINKVREQNSRLIPVSGRAAKDGDIVTIDFEGFIEDEAFPGGKAEDHELILGSKSFIDNFEEQIEGHEIGEEFSVLVKFPEDYHAEDLKGQEATFVVNLKDIKERELPEVDDDFAQDISEFDTIKEYKDDIREKLEEARKEEAELKKEEDILLAVTEKAEMEVPEIMYENQIDQMVNDFANQIRAQGLPLETYLQYMGQDMDSLREAYRENAKSQVESRLVLEAIAKQEDFEVTDEEIDEEISRMAEMYQMEMENLEAIIGPEEREGLKGDIQVRKAIDYILDNAVAK